jgi:hypothetical protein
MIIRSAIAISILAAFNLTTPLITQASAHALIELNGVSAVAGTTSTMTLEIQHGCLPAEPTVQVEAFVGAPWRSMKPQAIAGWASTVTRQTNGGWHITWTNQGEPIPFGKRTFFPITVAWPKKTGVYGMSVWQTCANGSSYYWNEKVTPATATADSPPLTPKPEVLVMTKSDAAKLAKPSSTPTARAHAH